ncbi:hypothetical protein Aperf_G00000103216 [Anoplocephala perfoliata]
MDFGQVKQFLQCEEPIIRYESLLNMCEVLSTDPDTRTYMRADVFEVLELMLGIFSDGSMSDEVLELNARALSFLIERSDISMLMDVDSHHFQTLCFRLDMADLSTGIGREFAERIIKFNPRLLYNGGAPTSVLQFLLNYCRLKYFFKDVVDSAMNIAKRLFKVCEPNDEHIQQWMEILNKLLDYKHDTVAKWTLQILGTIFKRFLQTGQDLFTLPAGGLDKSLSHSLYLTCLKFQDSKPSSYSLFYYPSLLDSAKAASEMKPTGDEPTIDESDMENISTLLDVLNALCCCSTETVGSLLHEDKKIGFCLINILRFSENQVILARAFELLQVLILKFGEIATEKETNNFSESLESFCSFTKAVDAIKSSDYGFIDNLHSSGFEFDYVDNQGQSLLDWAAAYGTPEMVEKIVSQMNEPNLEKALGFAVAFGRRSVCDILLKAGANPHIPLTNGMSSIGLARTIKHSEREAIMDLLEGFVLPLDDSKRCVKCKSVMLPIYRNDEPASSERSLFILAKETFLELSDTFERTQSETVKYKSLSILLQLFRGLSAKSLEILSEGGGSFRLCHMIRVALAQETVKIVHCAFQLSRELLQKAETIYRPLMYRHGIVSLMEIISAMLRLPNFHFKRQQMCESYYEPDEVWSSYSDNGNVESRVSEDESLEQHEDDGGLEMPPSDQTQERPDENENHDERPSDSSTNADKPPTSVVSEFFKLACAFLYLTHHALGAVPLGSARMEMWHDWTVVVFGGILFVFNESAVVLFETKCDCLALSGAYVTSQGSVIKTFWNQEVHDHPSDTEMREMVTYLIRKFRHFRFEQTGDLFQNWPFFNDSGHPLLERKRSRSLVHKRSPRDPPRRNSSVPPIRTFQPVGEEFKGFTIVRDAKDTEQGHPRPIKVGDLVLDATETLSGTPFMRVHCNDRSAKEVFMFSACSRQGFFKLDVETESKFPQLCDIVLMDNAFWKATHWSGLLKKRFSLGPQIHCAGSDEEIQLLNFDILRMSSEITSAEPRQISCSAPPRPCKTGVANEHTYSSQFRVNVLSDVAFQVIEASRQTLRCKALEDLADAFNSLKDLFSHEKENVTHCEITSSNLVRALLFSLSSSHSLEWKNLVQSDKAEDHLYFLLQRRRVFHEIFAGTENLQNLVNCILDSLDQTECLPLHIFEQITYPSNCWTSRGETPSCYESAKPQARVRNLPDSAPSSDSTCFDFSSLRQLMTEYCPTIPLGLVAPPLHHSTGYHNYLTGGGVRGLVDHRLLALLGAWFPYLDLDQCSASSRQIENFSNLKIVRRRGSSKELFVDEGKKVLHLLSRGYINACFRVLNSTEQFTRELVLVQKWDKRPRRSMPFLQELMKKVDREGNQKLPEPLDLSTGLVEWLGTCGGRVEDWVNPATHDLVGSYLFAASSSSVICQPTAALGRGSVESGKSGNTADKKEEEENEECVNYEIYNGKDVGVRWTLETGLQMIPTAFRVACIRRGERGPRIKKWCLQGSSDGKRWMTLFANILNEVSLKGELVTIPLNPQNYRYWSGSLSGCAYTSVLNRTLSSSPKSLVTASICTSESFSEMAEVSPSFRVFRIMDLAKVIKPRKMVISGFELFGTVRFVHHELLSSDQIAGVPKSRRTIRAAPSFSEEDFTIFRTPTHSPEASILGETDVEDLALDFLRSLDVSVDCAGKADERSAYAEDQKTDTAGSEASDDPIEPIEATETSDSEYLTEEQNWLEFADELDAIVERNMRNPPQYMDLHVVREPLLDLDLRKELPPSVVEIIADESADSMNIKEREIEEVVDTEETIVPTPNAKTAITCPKLAEAYMLAQMQRLLDGRDLNRLPVQEDISSINCSATALIGLYNPNGDNDQPSFAPFFLQMAPDTVGELEFFQTKPPKYNLQFELFARQPNGTVVASIPIDDQKIPLFNYILQLAEKVLYAPESQANFTSDGLPRVRISMEYSVRDPEARCESDSLKSNRESDCFLSVRDVRLANTQSELLENLGINLSDTKFSSIEERTEDLLAIVNLFTRLFANDDNKNQTRVNFESSGLERKLNRQLKDTLAISSGRTLPDWCTRLTQRITPLFPHSSRLNLFRACAFGPARSLLWLHQNSSADDNDNIQYRRSVSSIELSHASRVVSHISSKLFGRNAGDNEEDLLDQLRMDDNGFKFHKKSCDCHRAEIGRLFKNYTIIPRDEEGGAGLIGTGFWAWAERVMDEHAECKAELEIRFKDEEGTGLGPTLEFYNLISMEFRRNSLGLWVNSNDQGEYANPAFGLFPEPYPRNAVPLEVIRRFYIMGITVGKVLQDRHLLDLPFSKPLLKIFANYATSVKMLESSTEAGSLEGGLRRAANVEASRECIRLSEDRLFMGMRGCSKGSAHWLTGLLDFEDFAEIHPTRAAIFRSLLQEGNLTNERIEDLCLSMVYQSSYVGDIVLKDVYSWESSSDSVDEMTSAMVDVTNYKDYIRRTMEFCLDKGIRAQMDAFKAGFERVIPMHWLSVFTSSEIGALIRGSADVSWTREDLLAYTSPVYGYERSSPGYLLLIDVLSEMSAEDRREFLRFATGISALPAGGLKNLEPRLRVARKSAEEGPFPSVNTCGHYLKMPEFNSAEELYRNLKIAMSQIGFYLN